MTKAPYELVIRRYDIAVEDSWVIQVGSYIGGKLELDMVQDADGDPRIFKSYAKAAKYLVENG